MGSKKIAIVHDWLYGGGAEQVVLALHKLYPEAPIYTSYCTDEWRQKLGNKVITGYLQNQPFRALRKFLPLLRQRWFKKLDLSEFDIIMSSSGNGEAKFVSTTDQQTHICYCHTPTHFYWRKYNEYLKNPGFQPVWLVRLGLKLLVRPLRKRDFKAAQKVDFFIANSKHIQADIKKYYRRESIIIHPPVTLAATTVQEGNKSGFVTWGRHVPDKRFDIAIEACNALGLKLTIIGSGPETKKLKKIAGPSIEFAGFVPNNKLQTLAQSAKAFIFTSEEDFGISPVEALSMGIPVIAYKSGGALDFVEPGITGEFFTRQNSHALAKVLQNFKAEKYSASQIKKHAKKFSTSEFDKKIVKFVTDSVKTNKTRVNL